MIRISLLLVCGLTLSSCGYRMMYDNMRATRAGADLAEERAAILKLYRHCLEQHQENPALAKSQCEHYTQALLTLDVRGMR